MAVDQAIRDVNGTPIWYPEGGGKHYDRILKQTFYSKKEKAKYLEDNGLMMNGEEDPVNWSEQSGDMRNKSYRTEMENLKAPIK